MRFGMTAVVVFLLSGCTALIAGGGYQQASDSREAAVIASDSAITTRIRGQYGGDSLLKVSEIGVRTYKGIVTLTGSAGDYLARERAGKLARETNGVIAVNNQMLVDR